MSGVYGGIEAGGTKFTCAIGTCPSDLRAEVQFATTTPAETIERSIAFFREQQVPLVSIGIARLDQLTLIRLLRPSAISLLRQSPAGLIRISLAWSMMPSVFQLLLIQT